MAGKIILGTVQFGIEYGINNIIGKPATNDVFEILNEAYNLGVRILDTADDYGVSSSLIGSFHKQSAVRFYVNTKFKAHEGWSVADQLYNSLELLETHCVHTYFYHSFDDFVNYPLLADELTDLRSKGLIKKTGVSVYDNHHFAAAILSDIDVIQLPFNLLDNYSQRGSLLKMAKERNKEIHARSIFLQGLFFKSIDTYPDNLIPLRRYMLYLNEIAKEESLNINQLALAYALSQKNIDYFIIGVDSKSHLLENISNSKTVLSKTATNKIDKIFVEEIQLLYPSNWV